MSSVVDTFPASVRASLAIPRIFQPARPDMAENVDRVVDCFYRARVSWCLVGAHAVGHYTEPRTTEDFDFVFDDAKWQTLEAELRREFPDTDIDDIGMAVRLRALAVDLIRASSGALFRAALADSVRDGRWFLPSVEVLIVLKFLAATGHYRKRAKKIIDTGDLCALYDRHRETLDRTRMIELSKLVYPRADVEFTDLLDRIERGLPLSI